MNWTAYYEQHVIAAPCLRNDETSKASWERQKQDSRETECEKPGFSGLDVLGVAVITAALVLVLSSFNDHGIWTMAEQFPVSFKTKIVWHFFQYTTDNVATGVRPINEKFAQSIVARPLGTRRNSTPCGVRDIMQRPHRLSPPLGVPVMVQIRDHTQQDW